MTINAITKCIKDYKDLLVDSTALVDLFAQGNCFLYELPENVAGSDAIHAYPVIFEGNLVFLTIPSKYDTEDYAANINDYVTPYPAMWNLTTNRIPQKEARILIDAWGNDYSTWIPAKCTETDAMFRVFSIPMSDFEIAETQVNLALKPDAETPVTFNADIVVTNREQSDVYYDDFAKPIPPYPLNATESFYLLTL
jgi:hypothetical protein